MQQQQNFYVTIIQANAFPTKNQTIVMDSTESIPLNDYILAIGKITNFANIRFALKISMNRVCIYLASKAMTDDTIKNKRKITVGNTTFEIRVLVTKFKRPVKFFVKGDQRYDTSITKTLFNYG